MRGPDGAGIVPLHGIAEALDAAEAAASIGEAWERALPGPVHAADATSMATGRVLDEAEAKALLVARGLPVPGGRRASGVDEAVSIAKRIGFPVAVKALGLAHKSEHGAVRLDLPDDMAVAGAARGLLSLGTGLYVERMVGAALPNSSSA